MTFDLAQAEELAKVVQKTGVVFALTHNYTGYPLVRQARDMVKAGELGEINAVRACYVQGWLRTRLEKEGQKQAGWRTDPKKSGAAGCFGDIGTHAYNLGRFITGLIPEQIACVLKTFEPGRALDDYGAAVIRYANGALGTVTASQISHGRENDIWIEIDGTKASLEWHQEEPNKMLVRINGKPHQLYTRAGGPYLGAHAAGATRIPSGHPEAFLEAFANVYTAAYEDMAKRASGQKVDGSGSIYPNVADGVDGMNFMTQSVASSAENGGWRPLKHAMCRS
jgi:predicted dehydrogenase